MTISYNNIFIFNHFVKHLLSILINFGGSYNGICGDVLLVSGLFYSHHLYFYGNLVYFPRVGTLYQEKSSNPVRYAFLRRPKIPEGSF
jgi:hypothetical protein